MNKAFGSLVILALIVGVAIGFLIAPIAQPQPERVVSVENNIVGIYFSPDGECEAQVLYWIDQANSTIHVMIFSFTLDSVSNALIEAHQRGVEVKVVFERSQISKYSEYSTLANAGIQVRNDTNSRFMHNKVMIVDGIYVLTGSFNWSASAQESNDENLVVIKDSGYAQIYEEKFLEIWQG